MKATRLEMVAVNEVLPEMRQASERPDGDHF
jgi:hypothetical protein